MVLSVERDRGNVMATHAGECSRPRATPTGPVITLARPLLVWVGLPVLLLVAVYRDEFYFRRVPLPVHWPAVIEAVAFVLCMGQASDDDSCRYYEDYFLLTATFELLGINYKPLTH